MKAIRSARPTDKMPLTVALDARLLDTRNTGDTSYWRGLTHGFTQINPDLRFLFFARNPQPAGLTLPSKSTWIHLPAPNNRIWSLLTFPTAARRAGAHVLHTQYNVSPLARNPVTTIHDISFFIDPSWFQPRDRTLLSLGIRAAARRARQILTVSETSRAEIERYLPAAAGKITVTYNALDPEWPTLNPEQTTSLLAPLGLPERYLLTVGTRWPRKNMNLARQAAQAAQIPLVVTGQYGWGDEDPGSIATGYVDKPTLAALYTRALAYLAPSRHEGFGIPLLEAWASHCPVIASTGGALPEIAEDAAIVVPSWEPQPWAEAIQRLAADPLLRQDLIQKGQSRLSHFSWAETARRTCDVYHRAAEKRSN